MTDKIGWLLFIDFIGLLPHVSQSEEVKIAHNTASRVWIYWAV